jgi:hypothetical protein
MVNVQECLLDKLARLVPRPTFASGPSHSENLPHCAGISPELQRFVEEPQRHVTPRMARERVQTQSVHQASSTIVLEDFS